MTFDLSQIGFCENKKFYVFWDLTKEILSLWVKETFFGYTGTCFKFLREINEILIFAKLLSLIFLNPALAKTEKGSSILEPKENETSLNWLIIKSIHSLDKNLRWSTLRK